MRKVLLTELLMIKIHANFSRSLDLTHRIIFIMSLGLIDCEKKISGNALFVEAVKYSDMGRTRAL